MALPLNECGANCDAKAAGPRTFRTLLPVENFRTDREIGGADADAQAAAHRERPGVPLDLIGTNGAARLSWRKGNDSTALGFGRRLSCGVLAASPAMVRFSWGASSFLTPEEVPADGESCRVSRGLVSADDAAIRQIILEAAGLDFACLRGRERERSRQLQSRQRIDRVDEHNARARWDVRDVDG